MQREAMPVDVLFVGGGPACLAGAIHHLRKVAAEPSAPQPPEPVDPVKLTAELRAEAERLGMSRIGITHNDPLYSFADSDAEQLPTVIVCVQDSPTRPPWGTRRNSRTS